MDENLSSVPGGSAKALVHLKLPAVLENVPVVTQRLAEAAKAVGFDGHALYQIELAVDEVCANVVEHAYSAQEQGDMEVSCHLDGQTFVVRVRDWGAGFDPNGVEKPDVNAPLEERGLGGLGLFLVQQAMDEVKFSFDPHGGSELLMRKRLEIAE
jgi:serine/threonine-protein kinase RsbW